MVPKDGFWLSWYRLLPIFDVLNAGNRKSEAETFGSIDPPDVVLLVFRKLNAYRLFRE